MGPIGLFLAGQLPVRKLHYQSDNDILQHGRLHAQGRCHCCCLVSTVSFCESIDHEAYTIHLIARLIVGVILRGRSL